MKYLRYYWCEYNVNYLYPSELLRARAAAFMPLLPGAETKGGCRATGRKRRSNKAGGWQDSARTLCLIKPPGKALCVQRLEIDEFDAHTDARLHDANDSQGLDGLVLAFQGDTSAGT